MAGTFQFFSLNLEFLFSAGRANREMNRSGGALSELNQLLTNNLNLSRDSITAQQSLSESMAAYTTNLNLTGEQLSQYHDYVKDIINSTRRFKEADDVAIISQALLAKRLSATNSAVGALSEGLISLGIDLEKNQNLTEKLTDDLTELGRVSPKSIEKFNDALNKLSDVQQNLSEKQAIQLNEAINDLNDRYKAGQIDIIRYRKELEGLNYTLEKQQNFSSSLKNLWETQTSGIGATLRQVIGAALVLEDFVDSQNEIMKTTRELGLEFERASGYVNNFRKQTRIMRREVMEVARENQIRMTEASTAINAIAATRMTRNIDEMGELATVASRMGFAFGASADQAADYMAQLKLVGGLDIDGIRAVGDAMADVQHQMGLTSEESREVIAQVTKMIRQMRLMGNEGVRNAEVVAEEVSKMTAAFRMAGLEASQASEMLNRMMNPDEINQNIMLWNALGMSAADGIAMMSGDGAQMIGMTERMVGVARDLKDQYGGNIFALKAMAEAHGMSLEMVQQLAGVSEEQLQADKERATLEEQAAKARQSMMESIRKIGASLNIIMQQVISPLLELISPILHGFAELLSGATALGDRISELGIVGKVAMGIIRVGAGALLTSFFLLNLNVIKYIANLAKLGGMGGIFSTLTAGVKGFASSLMQTKNPLKAVVDGVKQMAQRRRGGSIGGDVTQNVSQAAPSGGGAGGNAQQLQKVSRIATPGLAKNVMAIGAAIFFVAAGVALVVASVSLLANAFKDLNLEQINGLMKVLAITIGGLVGVMGIFAVAAIVLGKAGFVAAPGILALGLSFLTLAAGLALIIGSVALLVQSMSNLIPVLGEGAGLAPMLWELSKGLVALAPGIVAVGLAGALFGSSIIFAGTGLMLLASAALIFSKSAPGLKDSLIGLRDGVNSFADLNLGALFKFSLALLAITGTLTIAAATLGPGLIMFGVLIAVMGGLFALLGRFPDIASTFQTGIDQLKNIDLGGLGPKLLELTATLGIFAAGIGIVGGLILAGITPILAGLAALAAFVGLAAIVPGIIRGLNESLSVFSQINMEQVGAAFASLGSDIVYFGATIARSLPTLWLAIGPLGAIASSLRRISEIDNIGNKMTQFSKDLATMSNQSIDYETISEGLQSIVRPLRRLGRVAANRGRALEVASSSIINMGQGLKNISDYATSALEGIRLFVEFMTSGIGNFSQAFLAEIEAIVAGITRVESSLTGLTGNITATQRIVAEGEGPGNDSQVATKIDETNAILSDIRSSSNMTNQKLDQLIQVTRRQGNSYTAGVSISR